MIEVGDKVLESVAYPVWREVKEIDEGMVFYDVGGLPYAHVLATKKADGIVYLQICGEWHLDAPRVELATED